MVRAASYSMCSVRGGKSSKSLIQIHVITLEEFHFCAPLLLASQLPLSLAPLPQGHVSLVISRGNIYLVAGLSGSRSPCSQPCCLLPTLRYNARGLCAFCPVRTPFLSAIITSRYLNFLISVLQAYCIGGRGFLPIMCGRNTY